MCFLRNYCRKQLSPFSALDWGLMTLLFLTVSGCAQHANVPDPNEQPTAVSVRLHNATVDPPTGPQWYIQSYRTNEVTYSRRTAAARDHSVVAFVQDDFVDKTFLSVAELSTYLNTVNLFREARYVPIKSELYNTRDYGQECVVFRFTVEDRGVPSNPGHPYILTGETRYKIHEGKVSSIGFSQRFLAGGNALDLYNELAPFLDSHEFVAALPFNKSTNREQGWIIKLTTGGKTDWLWTNSEYKKVGGITNLPGGGYMAVAGENEPGKYRSDIKMIALDSKGRELERESAYLFDGTSRSRPYLSSGGGQHLVMAEIPDKEVRLVAMDNQQNILWKKRVNEPAAAQPNSLSVTPDGGSLVGASSFSDDLVYLRYDPQGNLLWKRFLNHRNTMRKPASIIPCENGWFSAVSHFSMDKMSGSFAVNLDHNGTVLWKSDWFAVKNPVLTNANNGAFYLSGSYGISRGRIWASKSYLLDKNGQKIWENEFNNFKVGAVATTSTGGCILVGSFDPSARSKYMTNPLMVIFLEANGLVKKRIVFTSLWGAHPLSVQVDEDGGFLITGQ